ncbi:MAG TPA: NnrS family protein [Terrimicrobiaceae bacterium]|nr:NnrS family protein [Terrimicrobiaceae bacterium]
MEANPETSRPAPPGYWSLVASGEPFRLLFPLGATIGIFGVLLWPLFIWNVTQGYPGPMHARIMTEGFLACFVIGFLGTALPRLLDVRRMTIWETLTAAAALAGIPLLHFFGEAIWGDILFFLLLGGFVLALGVRFRARKDTPPPAFVLVVLGLGCALTGSGMLIISQAAPSLSGALQAAARLLLFQGFVLLPIMGVGAFLLPRFFGQPSRQVFPESRAIPPGWKPRALFALACGLAIIGSFLLEAAGEIRWGMALRAGIVAAFFLREIPLRGPLRAGGSLALGLRLALLSLVLGYTLMAIWPERSFSFLHLVFISGFSLLTFIVATRVVFGHGGQSQLFTAPLRSIRLLTALLVVAMLTRVTADWMPASRMTHYAYAAVGWIAGVLIWVVFILPGVRKADE